MDNIIEVEGLLKNGWDGDLYFFVNGETKSLEDIIGDGFDLKKDDKPYIKMRIELISK